MELVNGHSRNFQAITVQVARMLIPRLLLAKQKVGCSQWPSIWSNRPRTGRCFFRTRIAALGLKHLEVDQQADLADGYTNKVINGKKLPGALTIERLCRVLKI
jgi:hypothetical protein